MEGPFFLARSCVMPDEAFETLPNMATRLLEIIGNRPTRFYPAAVARGPGRVAGMCVRVSTAFQLQFEHVGYAFMPGLMAGNDLALKRSVEVVRSRIMQTPRFKEVMLYGGPALDWADAA